MQIQYFSSLKFLKLLFCMVNMTLCELALHYFLGSLPTMEIHTVLQTCPNVGSDSEDLIQMGPEILYF